MMNFKNTYQSVSAFLVLILFLGIAIPVFVATGMMEHCSSMMEMPVSSKHDHHEMMMAEHMTESKDCCMDSGMKQPHPAPTSSSSIGSCDILIDCNCDVSVIAAKNEAFITQKTKVPSFFTKELIEELTFDLSDHIPPPLIYSSSYSPPLLFLTNESLLI
tara:strand:- start:32247 stop:32726 length:480 start_codon:yes stop_codon:yes gene_type:complete